MRKPSSVINSVEYSIFNYSQHANLRSLELVHVKDKHSDLVLWEDLEEAGGEGGGRGDRDGKDM